MGSLQFVRGKRVEHEITVGKMLTYVVANELIGSGVTRRRKNLVRDVNAKLAASSLT
jgi:hypothetical protein